MVGVYASPRMSMTQFEQLLDRLRGGLITQWAPAPVVVAEDFNAESQLWESPATNKRGLTQTLTGLYCNRIV